MKIISSYVTDSAHTGRARRWKFELAGGIYLESDPEFPNQVDTAFINADGLMRNLYKIYWQFVWVWCIMQVDNVGHGGKLNEIFVNDPQLVMYHAAYALWHTILYSLALVLLGWGIFELLTWLL